MTSADHRPGPRRVQMTRNRAWSQITWNRRSLVGLRDQVDQVLADTVLDNLKEARAS